MENLSKEIINNCINSLNRSTEVPWTTGYLDDWSAWAKRMRNTINTVIPQLQTVSNSLKPKPVPALHPTDKEVETWFEENITDDCSASSASSAIYKFRLWLKDREISNLKK